MCCCSTWYSDCDLLKGRNLAFSLKLIFIRSPNICGVFQRLLFWMNTEHLTMFRGLLMLETNFSIKASLQNTQNYFLKSNSVTTHRDVSFSHKDVSGTASQGHVLVMPALRGAGRPRSLSCSLSHRTQASSGLEDVTAPYAEGLGMLAWAQCCRQRSCALVASICLNGSFSLSLFLSFPWHAQKGKTFSLSRYLHN